MLWIDTKTDDDARRRGEAQWTPVWAENDDGSATAAVPGPEKVDGQFWGDAIKEVQDVDTPVTKQAIGTPAWC